MTIADDIRAMLTGVGTEVTYTAASGTVVTGVPVLLVDRDVAATEQNRTARTAVVRVSKMDVSALGYRDTFTEADGTVWAVSDASSISNDRAAATWRAVVSTAERGRF